mgnify:CR=1 FL=1
MRSLCMFNVCLSGLEPSKERKLLTFNPPKNILVAFHDRERCLATAQLVKRLEYNSFIAMTPDDILLMVNGIMPTLVLLDLRMPFINGLSCIERLKKDTRFSMIKVLLVADRVDEPSVSAIGRFSDGVLYTPLKPPELYVEINRCIEPHPRECPRLRVVFRATVVYGAVSHVCFATMLSEKGIYLRTADTMPQGTKVRLSLDLPSTRPLNFDAEVIYELKRTAGQSAGSTGTGMGLKFVGLGNDIRAGIRRFVEAHLTGEFDTDMFL